MSGCGTSCYNRQTRAAGIVADGYIAGSDVGDHSRDKKRGYPFRSVLEDLLCLADHSLESSDTGADIDSESERIDVSAFIRIKARLLHCLPGRCYCIDCEFILFPCKWSLDLIVCRVEILHFTCNLDWKIVCRY